MTEPCLMDGSLRLRRFRDQDPVLGVALAWYQDREVLDGADGLDAPPFDQARVVKMYQYLNTHAELYIIEVQQDHHWMPIGDAALGEDTTPIVIGERAWRARGVGTRVLRLLIARAQAIGYRTLYAKKIWAHNRVSQRLYEGLGFERILEDTDDQGRTWYRYRLDLAGLGDPPTPGPPSRPR